MECSKVTTRFLILSDTHDYDFPSPVRNHSPRFRLPAPRADIIIHCGDLTNNGGLNWYKRALKMLGSMNAELKLVIAGNHDKSLDPEYWRLYSHMERNKNPDEHKRAMEMWTGPLAREAGVTYLEEGMHTFTLKNGAKFTVYASPYQPDIGTLPIPQWAFQYKRDEDHFNAADQVAEGITSIATNPMPTFPNVDIIVTHGPPKNVLDFCYGNHEGCDMLGRALARAKPLMHCFGHIHEGYGAKVAEWGEAGSKLGDNLVNRYPEATMHDVIHGKETLMVNAAIMDRKYKPQNVPWLVDLNLPSAPDPTQTSLNLSS